MELDMRQILRFECEENELEKRAEESWVLWELLYMETGFDRSEG